MADIIEQRYYDPTLTLDDIKNIPEEEYPILVYCDGGSLFGWLIRKIDHSAASHMQILVARNTVVTQWLYLRIVTVDHMKNYNCKLIWNPDWTRGQREAIKRAVAERLSKGKWETRYDVLGVIGEALNLEWLQKKSKDFCSEFVARVLRAADMDFAKWNDSNLSPTPKELNMYTKSHNPPYKVRGRYLVDD